MLNITTFDKKRFIKFLTIIILITLPFQLLQLTTFPTSGDLIDMIVILASCGYSALLFTLTFPIPSKKKQYFWLFIGLVFPRLVISVFGISSYDGFEVILDKIITTIFTSLLGALMIMIVFLAYKSLRRR